MSWDFWWDKYASNNYFLLLCIFNWYVLKKANSFFFYEPIDLFLQQSVKLWILSARQNTKESLSDRGHFKICGIFPPEFSSAHTSHILNIKFRMHNEDSGDTKG